MKRLISIIVLLSVAWVHTGPAFSATDAEKKICLSIILDSSPNTDTQWDILRALLLQAVHNLREGDKLEILLARPGTPSTQMSLVMGRPDSFERDHIIEVVAGLNKEFLFDVDVSRAVKAALESLRKNDGLYQPGLLVLTDGRMSDRQVGQIRRLHSLFKERGWPVCMTCDGNKANRQLLAAGNRDEIDLRFIDRPFLSQWIHSVRSPGGTAATSTEKETEPGETVADKVGDIVHPVDGASAGPVMNDKPSKATTAERREPVDVRIVEIPPLTPTPSAVTKETSDPNVMSVAPRTTAEDSNESAVTHQEPDDQTTPTGWKKPWPVLALTAGGLVAAGLFVAAYFIRKDRLSIPRVQGNPTTDGDLIESIPSHLVAYVGDRRQDLGEVDTVTEITIGKGIGSTIYVENEGVSDTHVRIFKVREVLKVQNKGNTSVLISGAELRPKAKLSLDLPADIEITSGACVTLLAEPIEPDRENPNNEEDKVE